MSAHHRHGRQAARSRVRLCEPARAVSRGSTARALRGTRVEEQMFLALGQRSPNAPCHATSRALSFSLLAFVSLYIQRVFREALLVQIYGLGTSLREYDWRYRIMSTSFAGRTVARLSEKRRTFLN